MSAPTLNDKGQWVIPATRRPDGTWRKEKIVKEGYIPQDEVKVFETIASGRGVRTIPGLPPSLVPQPKEKKNKIKSPASKPQDCKNGEEACAGASTMVDGSLVLSTAAHQSVEPAKRLKALNKKIREIDELISKKEKAEIVLSQEQFAKIEKRQEIIAEIASIESLLNSPIDQKTVDIVEDTAVQLDAMDLPSLKISSSTP